MAENDKYRATGRTDVESYLPSTFDEVRDGPALVEIQLTEKFTGDIEGEGIGRALQTAPRDDGTAILVGLERVRGSVAGRKGTFLLQVRGTVAANQMRCKWSVVPGSGTGQLTGLRGTGGFNAQRGQHGSFWLDYYFK
jgi:hypothetical protein